LGVDALLFEAMNGFGQGVTFSLRCSNMEIFARHPKLLAEKSEGLSISTSSMRASKQLAS
jgi:hypothetical protein